MQYGNTLFKIFKGSLNPCSAERRFIIFLKTLVAFGVFPMVPL